MNAAGRLAAGLIAAVALAVWPAAPGAEQTPAQAATPASLTDREFWSLSEDLSEPGGTFRSDNLLSNETQLQAVIPDLLRQSELGGVYLGVGPEQNFTYMAALRPRLAFILDIRRGNLQLQLMYKALFELSRDRAEFMSRLFTKPRPDDLPGTASVEQLMSAYWGTRTSNEPVYRANFQAIVDQLTRKHRFALSEEDIDGIEYVYHSFYWFGPSITYASSSTGNTGGRTTYAQLMMLSDGAGQPRGYLANEESFGFVKDLESKNLVVPVVGNFAGPKAVRAVGRYLKEHAATVSAFYLSNVEQYLLQDGLWPAFCANAATLPMTERSFFIRSLGGQSIASMIGDTRPCAPRTNAAGRGRSPWMH